MIVRRCAVVTLTLAAACDSGAERELPSGDDGSADEAPPAGEGEGEGEPAPPVQCEIGQVLREGRCLETCNNDGLVCDPDAEVCVRRQGQTGCQKRCGRTGGDCAIGEVCYVVRDPDADQTEIEGFCAQGGCPEGSHPGTDGWCVCDTGDIPPADLPCKVEQCGPGNHSGRCVDPVQICVDGECR